MSFTVGTPNCASANDSGVSVRSTAALPISSPHRHAGARDDALDDRVGLRMDGRRVERVVAVHDSEEAGRLLEGPLAEPRHLEDLLTVAERPVLVAERDDVPGDGLAQAGDARQQRRRGGVDVRADRIDAVLDHRVELPRQQRLVDVVLVLADADRLRLDAHELGERILQAAGDRHRAAQRHVEIRELLRRQLGRRVDRRAGLRHHDLGERAARDGARSGRRRACRSRATRCRCRSRSAARRAARTAGRACGAPLPSRCAARADRRWPCRAACRCRRRRRPSRRCGCRDRAPS